MAVMELEREWWVEEEKKKEREEGTRGVVLYAQEEGGTRHNA